MCPLAISLEPNEVVRARRSANPRTSNGERHDRSRKASAPQGPQVRLMPIPAPAAPGGQPAQPPFGQTQATGATPNKGYEAAGLQKLGVVVKQLEALLPEVGASSDIGKDVLDALKKLVKYVPAGSVTPAAQKNSIEEQQRKMAQNNQQMQAVQQMRQKMAGGQGQGGGQPGMAA